MNEEIPDSKDIKRIRKYHVQFYANKFDNSEENGQTLRDIN